MTNTLAIYIQIEEVKYIEIEGDLSKFHNIYVSSSHPDYDPDGKLGQELGELLYDYENDGVPRYKSITFSDFIDKVRSSTSPVIEIGFF